MLYAEDFYLTLLGTAVADGSEYLEVINRLLKELPEEVLNSKIFYYEVLSKAVKDGIPEIIEYLLNIDAIKESAAMNDNLILCNAAEDGNIEIVKLLLEIPEVRANVAVDDNEVYSAALRNSHFEVMNYLLQIPEVLALEIKRNAQEFYSNILPYVSESRDAYFEQVRKLLSQLPEALKSSAIFYNKVLCAAVAAIDRRVEVVKRLLEIPEVFAGAAMMHNLALRYALNKPHIKIMNCLLEVPSVFSDFECFEGEGKDYIYSFIDKKLEDLWRRQDTFNASHPHDVFPMKGEEVELCFYFLRNLIGRDTLSDYATIHRLLQLPALAARAHLSSDGKFTNELLHLAQFHGHAVVAAELLAMPLVHEALVQQEAALKCLQKVEETMVTTDADEEQRALSAVGRAPQVDSSTQQYNPRLFVEKRDREGVQETNPHLPQRLRK